MVPELRDLLHDAADSPEGDSVDTDVLLSRAQRRVTRRRHSAIAGASLGVAAVALAAAVLIQTDLTDRAEPATPAPTIDSDLAAARMAEPDVDYRIVASYDIASLAGRGGQLIESATPGGLLVYRDGPDGRGDAREIGLLNAQTGTKTPLPKPIAEVGANRIITSKSMIAGASLGEPGAGFWFYDTADGSWDTYRLVDLVAGGVTDILDPDAYAITRIQFGTADVHRLFLSIAKAGDTQERDLLVSVDLGDELRPVKHGRVSLWAMASGVVAYLPPGKPASPTLTLRDLSSGDEQKIAIPRGEDDCTMAQLWMRTDRLMSREECLTAAGRAYSLFQTFSLEGEPMQAITGTQFEVLSGADKLMLIRSRTPQGLFLYNIDDGEVLRLTKRLAPFTDLGASEGRQWIFLTPINGGKGVKVQVADLD